MFKKILVPTDGSRGSEAAFDYAADLAKKYRAKVFLVFVAEDPLIFPPPGVPIGFAEIKAEIWERGEKLIQTAVRALKKKGIGQVSGEVISGRPADAILKFAAAKSVDLVVMGSHGLRGWRRLLIGSVAGEVVRRCEIPVMTVCVRKG